MENFWKIGENFEHPKHTCTDLDPVLLRATFEIPWSNPISTKVARNIAESDMFVRIPGWINDSDWLMNTHIFCFTFCNILWCFIPFLIHSLRIHFRHSFLLLLIYIFLYHLSLSCYGTNSSEIKGTHPRYTSLDIKNVSFHNMNSRNLISQNFMVFQPGSSQSKYNKPLFTSWTYYP